MNLTDKANQVTCKFCLKKMNPEDPQVETMAEQLSEAWGKYVGLFGETPHGTVRQMAALLSFCDFAKGTR